MSYINYLKIKNKLCITYYGHNLEYLVQLRMLKPILKERFKEIDISFACRPEYVDYLEGISIHQAENDEYAYKYDVVYDAIAKKHPILKMLNESEIHFPKKKMLNPRGHIAYVAALGDFPNQSLTKDQIKKACQIMENKGFKSVVINRRLPHAESHRLAIGAAYVIGTSNELFYEAVNVETPTVLLGSGNQMEDVYQTFVQSPNVLP